jgi:hypothetical protein
VVPDGEPREYDHEDHRLLAVTFDYLVSNLMPAIDWDEIDGALLAEALAAPREGQACKRRSARTPARARQGSTALGPEGAPAARRLRERQAAAWSCATFIHRP